MNYRLFLSQSYLVKFYNLERILITVTDSFIVSVNSLFVQLQSCLLYSDLLHPPPDHGRLLPADGEEAVGTGAHWGGHAKSGKV